MSSERTYSCILLKFNYKSPRYNPDAAIYNTQNVFVGDLAASFWLDAVPSKGIYREYVPTGKSERITSFAFNYLLYVI